MHFLKKSLTRMTATLQTTAVPQCVPIDFLRAEETGKIVEITGPESWKHRLQEFGLREGVLVRMVKPGEPCILAVDGHRFSLRSDRDATILVDTNSAH